MTARGPFFMLLAALSAPAGEDPAIRVGRLGDPDAAVRDAAFRDLVVLAEREPRAVLRALPEAHDDPEVMIRCRELRERIGSFQVRAGAIILAKGDGKLTETLSVFFDGPITGSSVAALYRDLGERALRFRGVSLFLLDYAEPAVRLAAVRGLAEKAGIRGLHTVLSCADDPDPAVRAVVVRVTAGTLDPDTTLKGIDRLPVSLMKWSSMLEMAGSGTDATTRLKHVYHEEPRREAQARALIALGYSGDPVLAGWFKEAAGSGDGLLAGIAVYAAAFAAGDRESAWFASFLESPDPFLATAGALALCHVAGDAAPMSFRQFAVLDPLSVLEMAMGFEEAGGAWPGQPVLLREARAWWTACRDR